MSHALANTHKTINITSLAEYAKAKRGLLLKVRYTAIKLVVTDNVLGIMFEVSKCFSIK